MSGTKRKRGFHSLLSREASWQATCVRISTVGYRLKLHVCDVEASAPPLTRVSKARLPSDDYLFRAGIAGLTSFMARQGIEDYGHGLGEFLHALEGYYADPGRRFPEGLEDYIRRKTKGKARRYNVRLGDGMEPMPL